MVAKIIISKNIQKALNYNDSKVQKDQAELIQAGNFLLDKEDMNFYDKLNHFKALTCRNERATTNSLHISLNFDPSEKLSKDELTKIAGCYMDKIGFGEQPFLAYQHFDAGHPHIHIVTTNIRNDCSRINTHNIGRNQSEKARKEIEQEFNLVKASGRHFRQIQGVQPVKVEKIIYGQSETKRSITNVLDAVINQYKYTSLAELNAILKQYNVLADQGVPEGRIYKSGGLLYRVLDEKGNKIGVPIKASSIYSKPTLANLQKKFPLNEEKRKPYRQEVKERIDKVLERPESLQQFIRHLRSKGIETVLRQNDKGVIYGMTYVDRNSKSVFNGSDLGKAYSAASIQQRMVATPPAPEQIPEPRAEKDIDGTLKKGKIKDIDNSKSPSQSPSKNDLLQVLLQTEQNANTIPFELRMKKKKKRKRKPRL